MPPRAPSKGGDLPSVGDKGRDLEYRRTSRHHQPSRFAREKPLSPRASQSLKFRDKGKDKGVRIENPIRHPYGDLPLEFVKNDENGYFVQAKYSGNQEQSDKGRKNASSEDELIKYMSKVPKYLQKEEKIQDSVLNFGVLDWGRLEKWTNKQSQCSTSSTGSSVPEVDFSPIVRPMKREVVNPSDMMNLSSERNKKQVNNGTYKVRVTGVDIKSDMGKEMDQKQERRRKNKSSTRDCVDLKSSKGKEKCLYQDSFEGLGRSNKKLDSQNGQPQDCSEPFEEQDRDSSNEKAGTVFLLPKDFSRPCSSEISQKAPLNGKSSQHNWGSFSDFFSIDEIQTNEPFSDISHSNDSPNHTVETEKDLDVKLDTLIKSQGVELPINTESNSSDHIAPRRSVEIDGESSRHQRLGFRLQRMTRSLSFKESSLHPPPNSMHVTAKSGPAKPEIPDNNISNIHPKARSNPFKRLLNPIWKSKEFSSDSRMKPPIPIVVPEVEKSEPLSVKALLHLTVKGGLPLFKFVVETNNEILASTVKSLRSFGKDDFSLMYTFYSVHKVRKKTSGWKNQKAKPCGFGYNVVGQMKVSKPDQLGCKVQESVLYSADVSKTDVTTSDFVTGRELAAIIVNMPNETRKRDISYSQIDSNEGLFDFKDEKLVQTMVILPGGDHSLPHEGIPSSLINRWRTGGLCDCGGWDEGCKLKTLTDKGLIRPRSRIMDFRCDLYDQEESEQSSPFFRLVPFRDGLFSVEFEAKMSSLQAFSVCVAVINSKQPTLPSESKPESGECHGRHTHPHPPHSPAGRV